MRNVAVAIGAVLILALLIYRGGSSSIPPAVSEELARLRYANTLLQQKLSAFESRVEARDIAADDATSAQTSLGDDACH